MHQLSIFNSYVMINSLKQNQNKKDNVRIKVFTYPRSSTLKFASEQTDPYSHRDC